MVPCRVINESNYMDYYKRTAMIVIVDIYELDKVKNFIDSNIDKIETLDMPLLITGYDLSHNIFGERLSLSRMPLVTIS